MPLHSGSRPLVWASAAALVSGVLFHFGLGLEPIAPLAWLAPLPVLLIAPRVNAWVAAATAFLACFGGSAGSWSYFLHSQAIPLPGALSILLGTPLLFAATVALFRRLARAARPVLAAFAPPALWTSVLYGFSLASPTGVLGTFMTSQADHPAVLHLVTVTGGWGVEYLVLLAPASLAAALAPGTAKITRAAITLTVAVLVGGALVWGATSPLPTGDRVRVAVVARSTPNWAPNPATPPGRQVLQSYVDALSGLPAGTRIAVLPEAAFGATRARLANITDPLAAIARTKNLHIVTGAIIDGANTALDVPPAGPIVEYRKWRTGSAPATPAPALAHLTGHRIGLEVCMDVNGQSPTRDYGQAGTGLVLVPASDEDVDGWQHSRTALLRGAENGVSVAWSAARGAPMLSDASGHVLAETRTGSAPVAVAIADVPLGSGDTPYRRFGDWFAWLCGLTALVSLTRLRSGDQETRQATAP
ncbi:acyltransferase [Amycolatopsis sp. NPDC054798]